MPETLISDNGPQFTSAEFLAFAADYDFIHITSSPYFSQSNGEAERAVKTVKTLLLKNHDPHRALLAYRVTPLLQGPSPAEMLMGRKLRSPLPQAKSQFKPRWPNRRAFKEKNERLKITQTLNFNRRHKATARPELKPGQAVWISKSQRPATVLGKANTPRSYIVQAGTEELRRNRAHLLAQPEFSVPAPETPVSQRETTIVQPELSFEVPETAVPRREVEVEQVPETKCMERANTEKRGEPTRRQVKQPKWLRDYVH